MLNNLFQKKWRAENTSKFIYEAGITWIPKQDKDDVRKIQEDINVKYKYKCKSPQQNTRSHKPVKLEKAERSYT